MQLGRSDYSALPFSFEVTVNNGPHPEADSDFTLFCEVLVAALA